MTAERPLRVAVVGAGPAGVYTADALTFDDGPVRVDLLERLPVPFGLLRHGVAPDHLSIKSAENVLHAVLERPGVRLLAGVEVGRDVSLEELHQAYDVVVHAHGAPAVRALGVPGEDLPGSLPAASFVRWYGGEPDAPACPPAGPGVAVVGAGNVALDVARLLLVDPEALLPTDLPHEVLEALRTSPVTDVHLLVRRGLADVRFTLKELRELGRLPGVDVVVGPALLPDGEHPKPVARLLEVFREWSQRPSTGAPRRLHVHARTRPVEVLGTTCVEGLRVEQDGVEQDGAEQVLDVQTVLAAVGYLVPELPGLPHDPLTGAVACAGTRVVRDGAPSPTEHVAGWARRGATGVLGAARSDGLDVADAVLADAPALLALRPQDPGGVAELLAAR
ncbi:MAG: NADPH-dependent glutamate synthase beta chain-like oxidoreductase, partial [Frankiales bacterium]|nr:NADPH-dependent glutamate synthase beta chain-like oxidoreductase [Frankiales bacterium]